jgi:hypothetical protein
MDGVKTSKRAPLVRLRRRPQISSRGLIDRGLNRLLRISPYRCEDCD